MNILVVEGDAKLNHLICSYLAKSEYQPTGCLNPVEAYDLLYENTFDLIISDIMMPKIEQLLCAYYKGEFI